MGERGLLFVAAVYARREDRVRTLASGLHLVREVARVGLMVEHQHGLYAARVLTYYGPNFFLHEKHLRKVIAFAC